MLLIDFGRLISFLGWSNSWGWASRTGCHSWVEHYSCYHRRDEISRRRSLKLKTRGFCFTLFWFYFLATLSVYTHLHMYLCMHVFGVFLCVCGCAHMCMLQHEHGGQGITCGRWFSPSAMWVLRIDLKLSGLVASILLCGCRRPGTHYVAQVDLELCGSLASVSQVCKVQYVPPHPGSWDHNPDQLERRARVSVPLSGTSLV